MSNRLELIPCLLNYWSISACFWENHKCRKWHDFLFCCFLNSNKKDFLKIILRVTFTTCHDGDMEQYHIQYLMLCVLQYGLADRWDDTRSSAECDSRNKQGSTSVPSPSATSGRAICRKCVLRLPCSFHPPVSFIDSKHRCSWTEG